MPAYTRLTTAIADGLLVVPEGPVSVMRPPVGYDISSLVRNELSISHSFYPAFAAWEVGGYAVHDAPQTARTIVVVLPRSKALARDMVAHASAHAELVIVDGQKTDGVESIWKDSRKRLGDLPSVTKGHGRLFWMPGSEAFTDWVAPAPQKGPEGFYTTAGVFSDGAVDKGSALLADRLPERLPKRVADLGAGWGYLSAAILQRDGVEAVNLIEAEALSLDCARLNITDPRASFHWADATRFSPAAAYDAVVMNPPFHTGRAADPDLGRAFITASARLLTPNGALWMVANRHLPYEASLRAAFRRVDELAGSGPFKVFHATRPLN